MLLPLSLLVPLLPITGSSWLQVVGLASQRVSQEQLSCRRWPSLLKGLRLRKEEVVVDHCQLRSLM